MSRAICSSILIVGILASAGCENPAIAQCCEYHKPVYVDYAPQGMPDFDQKQNQPAWSDGVNPTHCGPLAGADCLWWLDSKFETSNLPPPAVSDGFPLVASYGAWDDHDTLNIVPFVNDLAALMQTNASVKGTDINDLVAGMRTFIFNAGLPGAFKDTLVDYPDHAYIKEKTLESCAIILLLGFYEDDPGCCRIGGHYVAVAGVCTTTTEICVSDPWFDAAEGEPPAGSAHGPTDHNDAGNTSGPHGQIQHDTYMLSPTVLPCVPPSAVEVNFPFGPAERTNFLNQNRSEGASPCTPTGAPVRTVIEHAVVLCSIDSLLVGVLDLDEGQGVPERFSLAQNYPNPFNGNTTIMFSLQETANVNITVFDILGQSVRRLAFDRYSAGLHVVQFDGRDGRGRPLASGMYFYRMKASGTTQSRSMVLLK